MSRHITVTEGNLQEARERLTKVSNAYLREVEEAHEEGYRPPHCFHGTNLWTDYDNICGPCEDGLYDPRWHSTDSEEFNSTVEDWAEQIARQNRYDFVLTMIKEDSQEINSRSDLLHLKTLIQVALDSRV